MQRTLGEHIERLEQKIAALKKELQEGKSPVEQREISADLGSQNDHSCIFGKPANLN